MSCESKIKKFQNRPKKVPSGIPATRITGEMEERFWGFIKKAFGSEFLPCSKVTQIISWDFNINKTIEIADKLYEKIKVKK